MEYKINKNLIIQKLDQETFVFNSEKSLLFTLNESAAFILKKIKSKNELNTIITKFAEKYNLNYTLAETDTKRTIKEFLKRQIII